MDILVNKVVSYNVKEVVVDNIILTNTNTNQLNIMVPYKWEDDTGKIIRRGVNRYTESQLITLFQSQNQDFTVIATALKKLLISNESVGNTNLYFGSVIKVVKSTLIKNELGVSSITSEVLTQEQIATVINPLTIEQLVQTINAFTQLALV